MKYFGFLSTITALTIFCSKFGMVFGIIGGENANNGQFRYQISLQTNNIHICGGVIIGFQHVLTAAHCFIDRNTNKFRNIEFYVVGGVINTKDIKAQVKVSIDKIYIPKEFIISESKPSPEDIAVLKLTHSLNLKKNLSLDRLKLPKSTYIAYDKEKPIVSGFGADGIQINYDSSRDPEILFCYSCFKLKFAETNIVPNDQCKLKHNKIIPESQLCAQVKQRNYNRPEGVCKGDSGSPLSLNGYIIGILSTGPGNCNESIKSGIYTRISSFLTFIKMAVKDEKSPDIRTAMYGTKIKCLGFCTEKVLVEIMNVNSPSTNKPAV